jgi:hypothetical protein
MPIACCNSRSFSAREILISSAEVEGVSLLSLTSSRFLPRAGCAKIGISICGFFEESAIFRLLKFGLDGQIGQAELQGLELPLRGLISAIQQIGQGLLDGGFKVFAHFLSRIFGRFSSNTTKL